MHKEHAVANHVSAEKRGRQNLKRNLRNKIRTSEVKTAIKALKKAIEEKNGESAKSLLSKTQSLINKLAKIGTIKKENAARKTSRLSKQVSSL